jgi:pimeloyl-ACP methyl ester carboxylesterase
VLPALEAHHEVLAPTLAGHAGGPSLDGPVTDDSLVDSIEAAMDDAGFERAHIVGNSLGGYIALQLAARGRAESVVALAPAGGWADGDRAGRATLMHFRLMLDGLRLILPGVDAFVSSRAGRRAATRYATESFEHIPAELIAHQLIGAASCTGAEALIAHGLGGGWALALDDPAPCRVRIVWGTADKLLRWPQAAARFREAWPDSVDWVVLDDVGHCPQLDVPDVTAGLVLATTGAL